MLHLARQARQTLKLPFVCSACRTLLAQSPAPRRYLPVAINHLGATRWYTDSTTPPPPPPSAPATTTEDATPPSSDPPAENNENPEETSKKRKPKNKPKSAKEKDATDLSTSTDAAGTEGDQDMLRDAMKKVLKEGVLKKRKGSKTKHLGKKSKPAAAKKKKSADSAAAAAGEEAGEDRGDKPKKKKAKKEEDEAKPDLDIKEIDPRYLRLKPIELRQPPVPTLAYGLDRVLFNPGVSYLQDPRSKVYNHDPYLSQIMPTHEFDFGALKEYITSSRDKTLIGVAAKKKKKYSGSTSSMTATLAHFHFLLSSWRPINTAMLSKQFDPEQSSEDFNRILRSPAAIFLHHKDGTYAIDADKEFDSGNILAMLGKSMEKFLTMPKEEFEKYRKSKSDQLTDEEKNGPESYHYTTMGDFMMRSQLDAFDPRLPGTGMFDLKTRAVVTIRMDPEGYEKGQGYEIRGRFGTWESYEREYFDMIRSAFLKYSLQVRMGRMDGIFVAYHNTERIFGFQYIPLQEMDVSLHEAADTTIGDQEFKLSVHLLNQVLDKVTAKFPGQTLRIHFETVKHATTPPYMCIFARPVTQERIDEIQKSAQERIQKFERVLRGLDHEAEEQVEGQEEVEDQENDEGLVDDTRPEEDEGEVESAAERTEEDDDTREDVWDDVMLKVEHSLENEEHGATSIRESIQDALQQSGLLKNTTQEEAEHYVQALFEVLTSEANNEAPESELAEEGEETEPDVVEESEAAEETAPAEPAVVENEAVEVSTEVESAEEGQEIESQTSPEKLNLKDLILRLASRLQEESGETPSPTEEGEVTGEEDEDAAKLAQFENIMSELLVKTRNFRSIDEAEASEDQAEATTRTAATDEPSEELVEELAALSEEEIDPPIDSEFTEPIYGLILTTKNKIDGKYVDRPTVTVKNTKWTVEYTIEEMTDDRAMNLYKRARARRKKYLMGPENRKKEWYRMFGGQLPKKTGAGRFYRKMEDRIAKERPVFVYGHETPYTYNSVFPNIAQGNMVPYKTWFPTEDELKEWSKSTDKMAWLERYRAAHFAKAKKATPLGKGTPLGIPRGPPRGPPKGRKKTWR